MGDTLEQYRARIGCHNATNVLMREESSFLTGRFLHKTLILFHLCDFLVIMLSFEMISYDVFVPLFLRLSNDVQEDPRPHNVRDN